MLNVDDATLYRYYKKRTAEIRMAKDGFAMIILSKKKASIYSFDIRH